MDDTTRSEYGPLSGPSPEPVADPREFPTLYSYPYVTLMLRFVVSPLTRPTWPVAVKNSPWPNDVFISKSEFSWTGILSWSRLGYSVSTVNSRSAHAQVAEIATVRISIRRLEIICTTSGVFRVEVWAWGIAASEGAGGKGISERVESWARTFELLSPLVPRGEREKKC
jgi:hypothetical protein